MWEEARQLVRDTFFKDEIEVYRNEIVTDYIGEELEQEVLIGTFKCNLQYDPTQPKYDVSGRDISHTMRISVDKSVPVDSKYTYKIKITVARLKFDTSYWRVNSWQEGQISTILLVTKEVRV